jgi:hypothetical protein
MKKKEVIAEVAFLGISPAVQIENSFELSDQFTITPLTSTNAVLINAGAVKKLLEDAIPEMHDDEEVGEEQFIALTKALTNFRDLVLGAMLLPDAKKETEKELNEQIAVLQNLSAGNR